MSDTRYLDWPFFEERHRVLARQLEDWAAVHVPHAHGADVDAAGSDDAAVNQAPETDTCAR